ncbi:type II secretion system protein [Campylobacter concisus]|uniref:Type II secretion system protein n=1 Tax=Campylobacter concisus TaxID=199 RepID=A0A7S9RNP8_9BACT|nr:type II secretion system protein [Campylobacter concisus]QPH95057.1 type II secretion system protein [Campylobacter concisus]
MKKRAFTMIELIFVIVVVGILAAIMIPKLNRNASREAANQILTHIRYTQHLAMQDDKYSITEKGWAKQRWTIAFAKDKVDGCSVDKNNELTWKYSVFFDKSLNGNINSESEVANDIYKSGKLLSGGWSSGIVTEATCKKWNKELNLGKRFGIASVDFKDGCNGMQTIIFDEMGRPMRVASTTSGGAKRPYDRLLKKDCSITITDKRGNQTTITIEKESGFASIKENG